MVNCWRYEEVVRVLCDVPPVPHPYRRRFLRPFAIISFLAVCTASALVTACDGCVRNSFAPYRGRNPQIGKRGFRSQKTPTSHHPRKGRSESKNPHFYTEHCKEKREFLTRSPLFWGGGKWGLLDSETLFSRFWGFRLPLHGANEFLMVVEELQRESTMHCTEVHHFASPFAPSSRVGENSETGIGGVKTYRMLEGGWNSP